MTDFEILPEKTPQKSELQLQIEQMISERDRRPDYADLARVCGQRAADEARSCISEQGSDAAFLMTKLAAHAARVHLGDCSADLAPSARRP